MSINKVHLSGNLTRDAELKALPSGTPVLSVGIAVSERVKNQQSGEWEDRPNYFNMSMFGARAEKIAQYLVKGTKVAVEGRLRYRTWEKDGETRSAVDVIVDEIEFMSRREEQHVPQPNYGPMDVPHTAPSRQNVMQAPPQVQAMVNDAVANATPFNSPYPGGNFPQQQAAAPEVWDEDIPFD